MARMYDRERIAREAAAAREALEAAVPGIGEILVLRERIADIRERGDQAFTSMMEDESNDGARLPHVESPAELERRLKELLAANPRAALYVRAKQQGSGHHWSDPTGEAGAARRCLKILEAGGPIEDAETALAERRKVNS